MKVALRKIGNSVGLIIPKTVLARWGLSEGDHLVIGDEGIRPPAAAGAGKAALDELKRNIAAAVASQCSANEIRAHGLANLYRWRANGVWVSAYDEWQRILEGGGDGELFAAMLGRDETS